tara:strand:+ start:232 stop:1662 length:1431 start_codon:yes stop_codon:yes gene_type:complete
MKSIRRKLTIWLSGGLLLLWVAAGAGIYLAVRSGLLKTIDAQIAVDKDVTRFLTKTETSRESNPFPDRPGAPRRPSGRMAQYGEVGSGYYYQTWDDRGSPTEQSDSIGNIILPFPGPSSQKPEFSTISIEDGTRLRAMNFRTAPSGKGRGKGTKGGKGRNTSNSIITIAHDLSEMEQTLSILIGGLIIVGLVAAGGTVILVGTSLNQGLKPLRDLGDQTATIDAGNLSARFDATKAPIELKPVYSRLNELMDRIQTSFDRERRFSADLAHEIRTPVAELRMLSEVALKWPDQAGPDTFTETLDIALQLETMIESLLALARWESGEMEPKFELIDLESLAKTCWAPYVDSAELKHHEVRFEFTQPTLLDSDPSLLRHVLTNLFSNAVEYTADRGAITVAGLENGIRISNSSHGLTDENVSHLFDRYWRRDEARSDSGHVGLGLSLARSCAEVLGLDLAADIDEEWLSFTIRKKTSTT